MVDEAKIREAAKLIIEAIGEDPNRAGLQETPERIGRMYTELMAGYDADVERILGKTFPSDNREMVMERDIQFYSLCEHHFVPFFGKVHIAYIPDGKVVGISKLARCVEAYARRVQIQENMTDQIADAIMQYLAPKGVMVMVQAEHLCMSMRGIKKPGTNTVTFAKRGAFATDSSLAQQFLQVLGNRSEQTEEAE